MRILIAGEQPDSTKLLGATLRELGHEIISAPAGPHDDVEIVEAAARERPDLVMLDPALLTNIQDLRQQTDDAQRERVRLLQVFAASADGIYIARQDGAMSMINEAALRLLGMSMRGMRGRRLADWTVDFKARTAEGQLLVAEALPLPRALQGEVVAGVELWIDALDGTTRCLSLSAAPVVDSDGRTVEAVAVLHDVTSERQREQEAARRAERRRRELGRLSTELLGAAGSEDLGQRCVARVREALDAERVRLITVGDDGKTRVLSGEVGRPPPRKGTTLPPRQVGLATYVLSRGVTVRTDDLAAETRFRADDGDGEIGSAIGAPLLLGERVLGVLLCSSGECAFFDEEDAHLVTLMANQAAMAIENLRLADRLAAEQKMAAVGVMAAGLVHEIKNPLAYVQTNIESAMELLDLIAEAGGSLASIDPRRVEEDRSALADAKNGCMGALKIVDDIRAYAHPGRDRSELNDINRLVEVSLTLAASALRRWCKVTRDFARLPPVACDGAKVSQAVLNLLMNAAQAIERSGRRGTVEVSTRLDEKAVRIAVADDGPGVDPAVREKIFLPFFTTKPAGVGTGLGLAISRRLIEDQGGSIEMESTPGSGARFTVVLPLSSG